MTSRYGTKTVTRSSRIHPILNLICREDNDAISPSETGAYLWSAANKQLKCFLVLDYTGSMADIANGGCR